MIDPKDVTIIIPHFGNSPEQEYAYDECLQSLQDTMAGVDRITVVNGVTTCSHIHDIRIAQQGQNKAVNAAVAITNTEWIFITNDDMVYAPGWFEQLVQAEGMNFGGFPNEMCISPRLVEPRPGAPTFEVFFAGGAGGDFNKENWLGYAEEHRDHPYRISTGFNFPLLIKRDLWDTIGGYDINYDPWSSNGDSDLQAKIHLAGVQPYQNPNSVVYHFGMTSGTSHPERRPFWEKNWHYFIEKWGFERASSPMVWESRDIIDYEKLKYHPAWEGKYGKVYN